ncbi:MAG: hypothetical protein HWN80_19500 [Candidatus Lokiarchaeota archaeon]|nr:hypothetical protein [Candidatus Lokiarchaeota archaeon]
MKKSQLYPAILITLFVLTSNIEIFPKVTAPPPPPIPTDYIADIFPKNNNTNIHLLNASTTITINATDFLNEIEVTFNGTYTLFNPGIPTNLTINLPFSILFKVENTTFGVYVNDTQVPFEIATTTEENLTTMGVNLIYIFPYGNYLPITLITSNIMLLENSTYIVKYQFNGIIPKPNGTRALFYMLYSSYTSKFWKGNATKRVEYIVFGRDPFFGIYTYGGDFEGLQQTLDFVGGKKFICEWDNAQGNIIAIEIIIDESTYFLPLGINNLNYLVYSIILAVIWVLIIKRKRK